ncbi:TlpA disulfide reductase family protein [Pedobacter frigoris]|uniref:peroxiredoxin family protein n=1 Tax=Pedobacter frigoris TaxID=2571272 RepID=UPI00292DCB9B|nr:TlpA disulfide reductase family protein [Pedobacter frigoris]
MKIITLIIAIVFFSIIKMNGQALNKIEADVAWNTLSKASIIDYNETNKVKKEVARENAARKYLDLGLGFLRQFPNDARKVEWFQIASSWISSPNFWDNIDEGAKAVAESSSGFYSAAINWNLFEKWEEERLKVRKIIMEDRTISEETKQRIRQNELELEMFRNSNAGYRGDKIRFLTRVKKVMENTYSGFKTGDNYTNVYRQVERLFFQRNEYGLNTGDLIAFTKYFKNSKHREIQQWAMQKLSVFALQDEPFELKHFSTDGREIDLAKLRGKVILVDFWSNTCAVCIERMPAIKEVYDKYKAHGFVVISAANNPNMDKEKIIAIHERIGADWPVMLIGGDSDKSGYVAPNSIADKIFKKYGFTFVPQLLLLDKEGKLAMYNGVLMNGNFEPLVQELLAK